MNLACNDERNPNLAFRFLFSLIVGGSFGVLVWALEIVYRVGQGYALPMDPGGLLRFLIGLLIYAFTGCAAGLIAALLTDVYYFATRRHRPVRRLLLVVYSSGVVSIYFFVMAELMVTARIEAKRTEPLGFLADGLILISAIILYVVMYNLGYLALRRLVGKGPVA